MKFFLTQRTSPNGENCAQASSVEPPNVGLLRAPSGMRVPAALLTSRGQTSVIDAGRESGVASAGQGGSTRRQGIDGPGQSDMPPVTLYIRTLAAATPSRCSFDVGS